MVWPNYNKYHLIFEFTTLLYYTIIIILIIKYYFLFFFYQKRVEVLYNVRSYSQRGFIRLGRKGQGLSLNFPFNWLVTLPHRFARVAGRARY